MSALETSLATTILITAQDRASLRATSNGLYVELIRRWCRLWLEASGWLLTNVNLDSLLVAGIARLSSKTQWRVTATRPVLLRCLARQWSIVSRLRCRDFCYLREYLLVSNITSYAHAANRERSYLNAIIAAGLAHAITKACSQGELPGECSCDKRIRSKNNRGKIEWVACSDDIDFGARFSRDFTDSSDYPYPDTTATINTHNYEVGRRVFKSSTDITCTCQDSPCQVKRCWKHLGPFADIGEELIRRYESATHVHPSSKDPQKLRPVRRGVRKPKRKDLVYIDESPDYCSTNTR